MSTPSTDLHERLELEIQMLRAQLAEAEEMQRAITNWEVDGFVVGHAGEQQQVLLLSPVAVDQAMEHVAHTAAALQAVCNGEVDGFVVGGEHVMLLGDAHLPYQAMIDRMHQGAITVSPGGEVLYANDRFTAMTGVPREQLLGSRLESCFVQDDRKSLGDVLEQSVSEGGQAELSIACADGSSLPVLVTGASAGRHGPVILMFTDLTERRLHHDIAEANRRKDEFLSVLAHELRNPLAPIRNCVQVLAGFDALDPAVRDLVAIIERQSATLARLLDDLLDIKRLDHGKLTLRMGPVDLNDVLRDAVEVAMPLVEERRHALQVDYDTQPCWVRGDPVRLMQVALNLLTNAAKYTPPGGHVCARLRRDASDPVAPCALLTVTDDGIGIAPAQLGNVFDAYSQLGNVDDAMTAGLGLGLTVVRQLLELHGGTVTVHSGGANQGSEFTVRLPIDATATETRAAVDPAPDRTHADTAAAQGLRILVADDNVDGASSLALLLRLAGHDTRTANDGLEALRVADAFHPEAAFLDLGMPGLDGYGVARELRKRPWATPSLAIFALTGWNQPEAKRRATEAGFDAHLVKPFDAGDLDRLIATARAAREPA
ncbi:MAG TPA: ATP-binding protein [Xanthomonadaceae bacterium]|nr:ATP-binding protein [Xanthomonadaceae bacterium]